MHLVKIDKDKLIVPEKEITYYINPDFLYIPVSKNDILVNQNDIIYKNSIVSKKNIFSPVSGKAYGMKACNVNGKIKNTLVIANDFRELNVKSKTRKKSISVSSLIKAIEFTQDKVLLNKFKSKTYENIVINAIDDNPYVYNKVFMLKENIVEALDFLEKLRLLYATTNTLLVIKNTDAFVIDECLNIIGTYPNIKLTVVEDEYLLENNLLKKLNLENGTLSLNIFELLKIKDALNSKISTTKLITISGDAIKKSKVIRVKKYTLLKDVINRFIDITSDKYKIIINGLMTGYEITNINNFIITDEVYCINIMINKKLKEGNCIKCGKCVSICPQGVNPLTLNNQNKCIDCGLCSYICPVYINLRKRLKEK